MEYQEEGYRKKVTSEISDESDVHDTLDEILGLMVAYGFHQKSIEDAILVKAEQYD